MEQAEEIIERISNEIKGKRFIKIPFWNIFANHIAYKNRFGGSEVKDDVCDYMDWVLSKEDIIFHILKDMVIYRARKISREEITKNEEGHFVGFDEKKSGMPPYRKTPNGRVNIAGIPILYTAIEKETACAELRPMKNDYISIAEYKITDDIDVANFTLDQIDKVEHDVDGKLFLKDRFESFSLPISNELIDYLPSEFISEYIRLKHTNLSGIRYSSLHNIGGYNLALFNDEKCEFIKSTVVQCNSVIYDYEEYKESTAPKKLK